MSQDIARFLSARQPYSSFDPDALSAIAARFSPRHVKAGTVIFALGDPAPGLFVIRSGEVHVRDETGATLSHLTAGNSFGERGLLQDGRAATTAEAATDAVLYLLGPADFADQAARHETFARFFARGAARQPATRPSDLATLPLAALMSRAPLSCPPDTPAARAARIMAEAHVSCLCVCDARRLVGIVTVRDLSGRVLGAGLDGATPVRDVMTPEPFYLGPRALGSDVLHAMMERRIGHVPVLDAGTLVGIVTQTDLTRRQAINSAWIVGDIARAACAEDIARATARIPDLLVALVGTGNRHDVVTRLITDIGDAATRRLLALAEARLGPPPVGYLWLACGSQGRREQTGVSDQDNCLILDDAATPEHAAYFEALARHVSKGLNTAGYVYCPGEMMATAPRWRLPLSGWQRLFDGWIATPHPEAQMLASVMFDLRPIGGDETLFADLQARTLALAARNSIFLAHMISNARKHQPPLGLFRGIATIRSGSHKNSVDLKHSGVVPVVDLGRIYALMGQIAPVNTRARIEAAAGGADLSVSGGRDLLDAYDVIADTRLRHQAQQIGAGTAPDNFLVPGDLSDFERSHLRDAFVVVRRLQSAIGQGRGAPV